MSTVAEAIKNYISNTFEVFNVVRRPENLVGISELIIFESLTSLLFYELFLPKEYPGLFRVVMVHVLSLPFLAAIPISDWGERATLRSYLSKKQSVTQAVEVSSRGIPAVFLSQFIVSTLDGEDVFRLPKLSFSEVLVTAGSKFITRPLLQLIYMLFGGLAARPDSLKSFDETVLKQESGNFGDFLRFLKNSGKSEKTNVFLDLVGELP
jgi:hypothetical protein